MKHDTNDKQDRAALALCALTACQVEALVELLVDAGHVRSEDLQARTQAKVEAWSARASFALVEEDGGSTH